MDFSARSGPLTCPPPGPPRLILPACTSKLSKLTGNAAPDRRTSGPKDACRHIVLFPQAPLAQNGHPEPRQELCVLVVFGINYALKLAARTQLEPGWT